MKNLLSILGVIGLTATSTTTLISCEKPNNNENGGGGNKPEPNPEPQQPPENSSWKINNKYIQRDSGWYIVIYQIDNFWKIRKIDSSKQFGSEIGYPLDILYHWTKANEPETPEINKNTGKITDWKE